MKLKTLCVAMLLAAGSIGIACANPVNLINNGDFSQTQSPHANPTEPTQFGGNVRTGYDGHGSCTYGGDFITGWTGNGGYEFWYPSASAATGTTSCNQYNGTATQRLAGVTTAPGPNGTFIGMDGQQDSNQASVKQQLSLVSGDSYTLSFWWGATEEMSRNCTNYGYSANCLSETLGVSIDNTASKNFMINNYTQQTFTGWQQESFTFTAGSNTNPYLTFLSTGTPSLPPFAVLTGVSLTQNVPEPPELALFGLGLLGLGLLTVVARRRALRHDGDGDIA